MQLKLPTMKYSRLRGDVIEIGYCEGRRHLGYNHFTISCCISTDTGVSQPTLLMTGISTKPGILMGHYSQNDTSRWNNWSWKEHKPQSRQYALAKWVCLLLFCPEHRWSDHVYGWNGLWTGRLSVGCWKWKAFCQWSSWSVSYTHLTLPTILRV